MDTIATPKTVTAVALILLLLAGAGIYQGWKRSGVGDQEGDGGLPTLTAPVTGARNASALTDPSAAGLNEAQVREIARQEARAALGQPRTPAAPASNDASDTATPATPSTRPAPAAASPTLITPPRPAPGPALQTPAAPAPADTGQGGTLF